MLNQTNPNIPNVQISETNNSSSGDVITRLNQLRDIRDHFGTMRKGMLLNDERIRKTLSELDDTLHDAAYLISTIAGDSIYHEVFCDCSNYDMKKGARNEK